MPDITYDVGRVSFIMKGAWNLATSYEKLDAVSYNGSLYIAKQDVPGGTAITNTTYWQLAAEKGDQGETGNGIASITLTGTAGNVDTYTITFTDGTTTTFTVTNGGVTTVNGRTGDVTGLAEEDGSYPLLNAGTAGNLTPYSEDSGALQDIPFIAQGTGCGNGESVVDTGSYCQLKKKLGNTVCVNQLLPNGNFASSSGWTSWYYGGTVSVANNTGTVTGSGNIDISHALGVTIPAGHTVLVFATVKGSASGNGAFINAGGQFPITTSFEFVARIGVLTGSITREYIARQGSGSFTMDVKNAAVIDLTLWFGSNDRIPSDLLAHPENWGRYYAGSLDYNAGTLESADGTVLGSIGRNMLNKANFVKGRVDNGVIGYASATTALSETATGISFTTNAGYRGAVSEPIRVSPNTQVWMYLSSTAWVVGICDAYDASGNWIGTCQRNTQTQTLAKYTAYFDVPAGTATIRFSIQEQAAGTVEVNDITISLYYSGEPGYSEYYPYTVLAEVDTGSEVLRGVEGSRDEKLPNGTITRNRAVIDMGTPNWYEISSGLYAADNIGIKYSTLQSVASNLICAKYVNLPYSEFAGGSSPDKAIATYYSSDRLYVRDTSYATVAAFKAAMSGVMLEYPLATPTTEQGTAFAENIPCDDFGSMYWTQTKGIPQGNEIFYPVDYKASIDTLYKRVGGDMSKIVTEDEYPEAPSSNGTYVLKATVSGGTKTYAWVAE